MSGRLKPYKEKPINKEENMFQVAIKAHKFLNSKLQCSHHQPHSWTKNDIELVWGLPAAHLVTWYSAAADHLSGCVM